MSAHPAPTLEHVYHVSQRKYNIDSRSPWWQRWFFRLIYLPFVRFSFKYVHIPAMDEVEINGKKITFCWYEDEGVFRDKDCAVNACLGEFWRVKPLPVDRVFPVETAQYNGHWYPRAGKPDRYVRPTFELVTTPRKQQEQILNEIARLRKMFE